MRWCGASNKLIWISFGLVDSNIIDLKGGREVVTHVWWESTSTFLFATIKTITFASHRTRLREAPSLAHCCVEDEIPVTKEEEDKKIKTKRRGVREGKTDIGSSGMIALFNFKVSEFKAKTRRESKYLRE
jgi:hypothetical protein